MASPQVGKKELGPSQRYYQTSNTRGKVTGETTDTDIYSYHRALGKSEQEALKRVDQVMAKHSIRVLTRPRK